MRLRVGAATDTGRVRELNEDAYLLRADAGLFVVCDGMGGGPAGEVASRMALDAIVRAIAGQVDGVAPAVDESGAPGDRRGSGQAGLRPHTSRLTSAVRWSNAAVFAESHTNPQRAGMATTVVGTWIREHVAGVAHVGDSRAYLWRQHRLERLTQDHALSGPHAHVLVRVLGREPEVEVDVLEVAVGPGDYLLLCSDGLTRMVADRDVERAIGELRDPQRICEHLVAAANGNGGKDNVTVVVVRVARSWWSDVLKRWQGATLRGHDGEADAAV
jgi:protein phosphatase